METRTRILLITLTVLAAGGFAEGTHLIDEVWLGQHSDRPLPLGGAERCQCCMLPSEFAHLTQPRPRSGPGFQVKQRNPVLKTVRFLAQIARGQMDRGMHCLQLPSGAEAQYKVNATGTNI